MDLLLALGLPILLLVVVTFILATGKNGLREKLFNFEMGGQSAQIWNFGVLAIAVTSIIIYFSKR